MMDRRRDGMGTKREREKNSKKITEVAKGEELVGKSLFTELRNLA